MTPAERQQLINRLDVALYELQHGPLVKFWLFEDIGNLTPGVLECSPVTEAQRVRLERKVEAELLDMVKRGDWAELLKVARTVGHFLDKPESPIGKDRRHPKALKELWLTLSFLRKHVDQCWTLTELYQRLDQAARPNRKTLERWCDKYEFPIKRRKRRSSKKTE
jgi:hypothetical protein